MNAIHEVFPKEFLASINPELSSAWSYLHAALVNTTDHKGWSRRQRARLRGLLSLAERSGLLCEEAVAKLRAPDQEQFWGKLNEFKVAEFLEGKGMTLKFNPTGRGDRVGEFLMPLGAQDIFVEVKTLFPRAAQSQVEHQLALLRKASHTIPLPFWISLWILEPATTDPRTKPFVDFLAKNIPILAETDREFPAFDYFDSSTGLHVRITLMGRHRASNLLTGAAIDLPGTDDQSIRASLRKASKQLPEDKPSLVVLCSHLGHPPSPAVFHDALFGKFVVLIDQDSARHHGARLADGFFRPGGNRRFSAVGFLDEFKADRSPPHMDFYHNPWASHGLLPEDVKQLSVRQCVAEIFASNGTASLNLNYPFGGGD